MLVDQGVLLQVEEEYESHRTPFVLHDMELGPLHCLVSLDFWLLFFVCAVGLSLCFGSALASQASTIKCI